MVTAIPDLSDHPLLAAAVDQVILAASLRFTNAQHVIQDKIISIATSKDFHD